jgi:PBZ domain
MDDSLQERVKYYNTELSKDYSNDEESLFKILFELFWETASNPDTNDLIMNVFKSQHTLQRISINDAFYQLFSKQSKPHRVINTYSDGTVYTIIQSPGEPIISVLFLKFIHYFASRVLDLRYADVCEPLSWLADLVGLTDNERILNAAVIDIGNFLRITTESEHEIRAIIENIHKIFTERLKIDAPDNISIQITISVICKEKLKELKCPTVPDDEPKPKPKPKPVTKSWDEIKALVDARTAAGITRTIVKTELTPLLTLTDEITDKPSKFRYTSGPSKPVIKKKDRKPVIKKDAPIPPKLDNGQRQRPALAFPKNKKICRYGPNCYLRNKPQHTLDYYHPPIKPHWRPGGGSSGKSKRTRHCSSAKRTTRRLSSKRAKRHTTRHRTRARRRN